MPAYLVELPEETGRHLVGGHDKMVVFGADAAQALDAAQGQYSLPVGADAMWAGATVTEIVAGTNLTGGDAVNQLYIAVTDASPAIEAIAKGGKSNVGGVEFDNVAVGAVALNDGGVATYVIDDILTAVGGVFTRAATFRVITVSTGVITAVELVDPGEYTTPPSPLVANPVTGGGGTAATLDLTMALPNSYEVLMGQMVTLLNADAQITGAAVDFSEGAAGARLLTISSIADALGDLTVTAELRRYGAPDAALLSTIVDGGIAAAVLTVAIPATPIPFARVTPVRG
jgi:hypothetical protein